MKERPILFSAPMVRAIMEGRKTQTRRVVKRGSVGRTMFWDQSLWPHGYRTDGKSERLPCPYGKPGDRLWVKETWCCAVIKGERKGIAYKASLGDDDSWFSENHGNYEQWSLLWNKHQDKWRPSIFMPRWASRINLEMMGIRIERLQAISEDDSIAEGVTIPNYDQNLEPITIGGFTSGPARIAYKTLWESINGCKSWYANPWVWVIEFKRI